MCVCVCFQVPEEMQDKEFAAILQDEPQQPLALLPLTEEEQVRGAHLHVWHFELQARHASHTLSSESSPWWGEHIFQKFVNNLILKNKHTKNAFGTTVIFIYTDQGFS